MTTLELALSAVTEDVLKGLLDEELLALADSVGKELGRELVEKDERENAVEGRMARELNEDYLDDLTDAVGEELDAIPDSNAELSEVNLALSAIGARLAKRSTLAAREILEVGLKSLAKLARRVASLRFGGRGPTGIAISGSLAQVDVNAVEALAEQQLWWIGNLWNDHLSRVISATVSREALTVGLGREQVGRILEGVVRGTIRGAAVPKTFRGSTEQYFRALAGTVRNQAANFGALSAMRDAGFTTYTIQAVLDERTSDICRELHGKSFRVSDGVKHVERIRGARDPEEYKRVAGWRTAEEVRQISGDGDEESQRRALVAAGVTLPPFHSRCRTIIIEED